MFSRLSAVKRNHPTSSQLVFTFDDCDRALRRKRNIIGQTPRCYLLFSALILLVLYEYFYLLTSSRIDREPFVGRGGRSSVIITVIITIIAVISILLVIWEGKASNRWRSGLCSMYVCDYHQSVCFSLFTWSNRRNILPRTIFHRGYYIHTTS